MNKKEDKANTVKRRKRRMKERKNVQDGYKKRIKKIDEENGRKKNGKR